MSTEFQSDAPLTEPEKPMVEADTSESAATALGDEATRQVAQIWEKVSGLLGDLPDYISDFFKRYRRPIVTVGLIFAAVLAVKIVLALLDAVNDVPLLGPALQLIGLFYTGWFLYRYLLKASNRQELLSDITSIRDQVLGKNN
ncbi:MAG: hypothetical protein HC929_20300 [Leptolyngbyaceae cyanobacterium SM2_5_2]|nr:hypothetical protein [Leptolyngbyaceae cyanobacterium SM2_5_2]